MFYLKGQPFGAIRQNWLLTQKGLDAYDQDASATKRLLLAGYAKHYSGSNRLEYGNIRNINPKALPDREVKEDDN